MVLIKSWGWEGCSGRGGVGWGFFIDIVVEFDNDKGYILLKWFG